MPNSNNLALLEPAKQAETEAAQALRAKTAAVVEGFRTLAGNLIELASFAETDALKAYCFDQSSQILGQKINLLRWAVEKEIKDGTY